MGWNLYNNCLDYPVSPTAFTDHNIGTTGAPVNSFGMGEIDANPLIYSNPNPPPYTSSNPSPYQPQTSPVQSPAICRGTDVGILYPGPQPDIGYYQQSTVINAGSIVCTSIQQLKSLFGPMYPNPTQIQVQLTSPEIVTSNTDFGEVTNGFYIEEPNSSSGIRVDARSLTPVTFYEGDSAALAGTLIRDSDGELELVASSIIQHVTPGPKLSAISMSCLDASAGTDAVNGLLATVSGSVSYVAPDSYVYVDDGSGAKDASGNPGIRVLINSSVWSNLWYPAIGSTISVTGPIGLVNDSAAGNVPCIRPRYTSDISVSLTSLTGTVEDSSASPVTVINNATITVLDSSTVLATGGTGSTGTYTLAVPVGTFTVTCVASGYPTATATVIVPAGGYTQNFSLTKITTIKQLKNLWASDSAAGSVQVWLNTPYAGQPGMRGNRQRLRGHGHERLLSRRRRPFGRYQGSVCEQPADRERGRQAHDDRLPEV